MFESMASMSSMVKGSKSRGESSSSVDDSCVNMGSSKAGGDVVEMDSWLAVLSTGADFLPAGSTAANASMPLSTVFGTEGLVDSVIVVISTAGLGFGDGDLNCTGLKTSYLVDHFSVFS
jgi:hypothetical protein